MSLKSIYTQLHCTAVSAGVLHAKTRLESHRLSKVGRGGALKELCRGYVHNGCSALLVGLVTCCRHNNLIHCLCLILHREVYLDGFACLHSHALLDALQTDRLGYDSVLAYGKILQEEVTRGVGYNAYGCTLDGDRYEGYVLTSLSVDNVSVNVGVGATALCHGHK